MTSDKNGPAQAAAPALDEDLDATRNRKDIAAQKESTDSSSATPSGDGTEPQTSEADQPTNGKASPVQAKRPDGTPPVPAPPASAPAPAKPSGTKAPKQAASSAAAAETTPDAADAPDDPGATVPTTGGIWRSAYEAGRGGSETDAAKQGQTQQGTGSQESTTDAKSWNRVQAPAAAGGAVAGAAGAAGASEAPEGVKSGAMKAAQAAIDAARSAARKVSSIMPDDEQTAAPQESNARPDMHYTAGGVRGTATSTGTSTGSTAAPGPHAAQAAPQAVADPPAEPQRSAPAGPRRVRLAISRVDPWSVMKLAFLLAVAVAIMTVVATAVFWSVLNSLGVFTTVQSFVADAVGPQSDVNLTQFVEFPRVISLATLISICNIVLLTAIATIMAFLYNITAALVGGVHMTLTDD